MVCSQCRCNFCWMCLRLWKEHTDYYNCNKFSNDVIYNKLKIFNINVIFN